jgi:hypothetical protein
MKAMPGTINGIGTCLCGGRGHVSWQPRGRFDLGRDATDYDALECFCVAFLPIVPYRALHAFGRTGSGTGYTYRRVPIRWSLSLLVRTFPRQLFRSESFARASMRAIEQQDWSAAMRAARLCAALEDVVAGERLTDEILSRAEVQAGIDAVLRRPEQWGEYFRPNAPEQVSGASEPGPQGAFAAS